MTEQSADTPKCAERIHNYGDPSEEQACGRSKHDPVHSYEVSVRDEVHPFVPPTVETVEPMTDEEVCNKPDGHGGWVGCPVHGRELRGLIEAGARAHAAPPSVIEPEVFRDGEFWLAEIDYLAQGRSREAALDAFRIGWQATIEARAERGHYANDGAILTQQHRERRERRTAERERIRTLEQKLTAAEDRATTAEARARRAASDREDARRALTAAEKERADDRVVHEAIRESYESELKTLRRQIEQLHERDRAVADEFARLQSSLKAAEEKIAALQRDWQAGEGGLSEAMNLLRDERNRLRDDYRELELHNLHVKSERDALRSEVEQLSGERDVLARFSAQLVEWYPRVAQLLDGWHADGTAWSEWDESVRRELIQLAETLGEVPQGVAAQWRP